MSKRCLYAGLLCRSKKNMFFCDMNTDCKCEVHYSNTVYDKILLFVAIQCLLYLENSNKGTLVSEKLAMKVGYIGLNMALKGKIHAPGNIDVDVAGEIAVYTELSKLGVPGPLNLSTNSAPACKWQEDDDLD
jgi:hypothetical protein